jgi:hypothetical protein
MIIGLKGESGQGNKLVDAKKKILEKKKWFLLFFIEFQSFVFKNDLQYFWYNHGEEFDHLPQKDK